MSPDTKPSPRAAVLLVVDKSGSMAGHAINDAKAACLAALDELGPEDFAGVLAFDASPHWVAPFAKRGESARFEQSVAKLLANGGTRIHPALVEALKGFQSHLDVRAAVRKHIILLSDGNTPPDDLEAIVKELVQEGVTVSTVCLGSEQFDAPLMAKIAELGRGRFTFTNSTKNIPQLFVNEMRQALKEQP